MSSRTRRLSERRLEQRAAEKSSDRLRREQADRELTRRQKKKIRAERVQKEGYRDYSLLFIIMFLLSFGLVMLYSTSSYEATMKYGNPAFYLKKQMVATILGLIAMFFTSLFPYRKLRYLSRPIYLLSLILVILIIPFGREANGAKRWLYIGSMSIQPAEAVKIGVLLITAVYIEKMGRKIRTWKGMIALMIPALIGSAMIYVITRNMSSAIIIMAIAAGMVFVAAPDYKRFFLVGGVVSALAFLAVRIIVKNAENAESMNFRGGRILAWLDPNKYAGTTAFQTLQGLYAIGSGGVFGKGLGQSMQKLGYIPEAQNDMIFSIICEELGIFGAVCILMMFVMLAWRFLVIANNAEDLYGGMLVVGVMTHISIQVIFNIAVVTNTMPNTGVTLPFISYGGTSILFLMTEMGLVLSVARSIRLKNI